MYKENDQFEVRLKIKKVIFKKEDSFFKILKVTVQKQKNNSGGREYLSSTETLLAELPIANVGDMFEADVVIKRSKHGYNLELEGQIREVMPADRNELIAYLTRKLKGVGKKSAKNIVKEFGMDAIMTIRENGVRSLIKIGFTEKKANSIFEQVEQQYVFSELSTLLLTNNIPLSVAVAIYEKLGNESLIQIGKSPYTISRFVDEVPFFYVDILGYALGKKVNDQRRIEASVLEFIQRNTMENGDVYTPLNAIYSGYHDYLDYEGDFLEHENATITIEDIDVALKILVEEEALIIEDDERGNKNVYLTSFARIENKVVNNVERLFTSNLPALVSREKSQLFIEKIEKEGFLLSSQQKKAVVEVLQNKISILTGGPGTGKTYTTNMIVNALKHNNPNAKVALLAPTGKAAQRLSELTNMEAMTIHRKLKIFDNTEADEHEVVEEDFIVVDESSMIDIVLFNKLMNNLGENTRLLLVGDVEQLPSIGAGLVLKDLIESECIPMVELTEVFRQTQDSQIITNAHKIIQGEGKGQEEGIVIDNKKGDMYWIEQDDAKRVKDLMLLSMKKQIEQYNHKVEEVVILSPMRKHELGTIALNMEVQKMVNPPSQEKNEITVEKDESITYREGDRVIHLVNNAEKNITNGETGTIMFIGTEVIENELTGSIQSQTVVEVEYERDKIVKYSESELDDIELAYAMSIHKSQGSEFEVVIMPVHQSHQIMLQRNLIYTGVTRAKEKLVMIGQTHALNYAIDNTNNLNRHTKLKEKLKEAMQDISEHVPF